MVPLCLIYWAVSRGSIAKQFDMQFSFSRHHNQSASIKMAP